MHSGIVRTAKHVCHRRIPRRGQSHVVGVVLMLALTAIAIGGLTASIGAIIQDQTSYADATSVSNGFDSTLRPVETTGPNEGTVTFTEGTLRVVSREVRILDTSGIIRTVDADALVYTSGESRVAYVGGAIVRGRPGIAWMEREPPIVGGPNVLIIGVPRLGASAGIGGSGGVTTTLETNVSHRRYSLGVDTYAVAIETVTPAALNPYVEAQNATSTMADFDGDGIQSIVIEFAGNRIGYLVVHEMRLEVGNG